MRPRLGVAALVLVAGCGGGSTDSLRATAPPVAPADAPRSSAPAAAPTTARATAPARVAPPPSPTAVTVVSATAGTVTAGLARVSSPAASTAPRPARSPVGGTVTVTDDDSGTTVRLARGQRLRARLSQDSWTPPESSAADVVARLSSTGGYPSDQPVDAVFEAVGAGTAEVTSQTDAPCFHSEPPCLMPQRMWQVTVVVS